MYKIKECRILVFAAFLFSISLLNASAQAPKKIRTIVVDAGHGGNEPGAHADNEGSMGTYEKNVTLAISNKLVAELKRQMPDTRIVPTRTSDVTQPVKEKARIANENHGDLFVCIHADALSLKTGSRITGYRTETYTTTRYVGKGKHKKKIVTPHQREVAIRQYFKISTTRKGTSTLIFAARKTGDKIKAMENSDMLITPNDDDSTLDINYNSPEWKANALLYTQNYFKKSFKLGSLIQDEITDIGRDNLGVWQRDKGIWVLQATQMPAVLIETGFITTPEDERYLNSEKGQQEIAEAIAKAIKKYKDQVENPKLAGQVKDTSSN